MKNILFYCNTHYQIIISLQIAKCFFRDDNVNFIISDHSKNAKRYADNLRVLLGSDKVLFISSKKLDYCNSNVANNLYKSRQFVLNRFPLSELPLKSYDEFIAYNATVSVEMLVKHLKSINPNIVISRMEEGLLSYNFTIRQKQENLGLKKRLSEYIKSLLGWYDLYKYQQNMYCTYPELYEGKLNTIQIPKIDTNNKEFIENISKVFGVDKAKLIYPQKYIFFSSILDFEGGEPVGELEMAKKIADLVGKENLLVKVHPRDDVERFKREGLTVDENSSVPWEAIQLNYDFSNHVFLTVVSTSVLNISSIINNPPKTFMLYDLIEKRNNLVLNGNIKSFTTLKSKLDKTGKFDFIRVANSLGEIV